MDVIYKSKQQLSAWFLLISLSLQSCAGITNNPLSVQQNSGNMQAAIEQLADNQLISKEGHLISFFCDQAGHLQAEIEKDLQIGFSNTLTLPVYIETGIPFDTVFRNEIVHVNLPYKGQEGYVYLGSTALKGGSNSGSSKGKEKLKDDEYEEGQIEEEKEQKNKKQGSTSYIKDKEDEISAELVDSNHIYSKKYHLQPENYERMIRYLQKIASKGDKRAINLIKEFNEANLIGEIYLLEESIDKEQDDENESKLIRRAAEVWNKIVQYISYSREKPAMNANPFHSKFKINNKLYKAIIQDNVTEVNELLALGANIYIRNKYGDTPLNIALANGHLEIVKLLLEKGAYVNLKDKDGNTPLHVASINGQVQMVKLLIEKGADVNVKCTDNMAPLHIAISSVQEEIVKLLLKAGADVNATCNDGWTALHSAACDGHLQLMILLIEHGADIYAINSDGTTPMQIFAKNNCGDLFDLVEKKQRQC
jgi:ankyrin repeat protein